MLKTKNFYLKNKIAKNLIVALIISWKSVAYDFNFKDKIAEDSVIMRSIEKNNIEEFDLFSLIDKKYTAKADYKVNKKKRKIDKRIKKQNIIGGNASYLFNNIEVSVFSGDFYAQQSQEETEEDINEAEMLKIMQDGLGYGAFFIRKINDNNAIVFRYQLEIISGSSSVAYSDTASVEEETDNDENEDEIGEDNFDTEVDASSKKIIKYTASSLNHSFTVEYEINHKFDTNTCVELGVGASYDSKELTDVTGAESKSILKPKEYIGDIYKQDTLSYYSKISEKIKPSIKIGISYYIDAIYLSAGVRYKYVKHTFTKNNEDAAQTAKQSGHQTILSELTLKDNHSYMAEVRIGYMF